MLENKEIEGKSHLKDSSMDEIGFWSEIKLEIIKEYAKVYSLILKKNGFQHFYIDAFAGSGKHISKVTKKPVPGSPLNALDVKPPFDHFFFIDIKHKKAKLLRKLIEERNDVTIYEGDCNKILIDEVFPLIKWKRHERALCLLDPYGLHLKWDVIYKAGMMKCIEIFLNFPVMDMNMNALLRKKEKIDQRQKDRMNNFWGDESWQKIAYDTSGDLFGHPEKVNNANYVIAQAFKERLKSVAGFEHVPEPIPMRNNINRIIYYIFFAAHKPVSKKIVKSIFKKWGET